MSKNNTKYTMYSPLIDNIIDWGRNTLFPGEPSQLEWIEEDNDITTSGLQKLRNHTEKAMAFFSQLKPAELYSSTLEYELDDETDTNRPELNRYLDILDDIACLEYGADSNSILREQETSTLTEETKNISLEVASALLPFWKLIPLNEQRSNVLSNIVKKEHYRFPWYGEWSDVPVDNIDILAEQLAGETIPNKDVYFQLDMLHLEISQDSHWKEYLDNLVSLILESPQAIKSAYAYRWYSVLKDVAREHILPEGIYQEEGLYISRLLIAKDIVDGKPKYWWRLYAAFAAGLSGVDRLTLLEVAEQQIKELNPEEKETTSAIPLNKWLNKTCDDEQFLQELYNGWQFVFEYTASQIKVGSCSREEFFALLEATDREKMAREIVAEADCQEGLLDPIIADLKQRLFIDIPSAYGFIRGILENAFPAQHTMATADSHEAFCVYTDYTSGKMGSLEKIEVTDLRHSYDSGILSYEAILELPQELSITNKAICGLLIDGKLEFTKSCQSTGNIVKIAFYTGREIAGKLHIILVRTS